MAAPITPAPITPTVALLGPPGAAPKPTKLEDAAQQFESILLTQMLRSARESASELGGEDEADSESSTMLEFAEQQFAQVLAHQGGFGLARLVVAGLEPGQRKI